jgi:shikimate kinase
VTEPAGLRAPRGRAGEAQGPAAILIGPPGAGKSTVGTLLAAVLGLPYTDTDTVIEQQAGKPVGDIFIQDGEQEFRALERAAVARCVASHRGILGLGGGAVLDPGTQQLLAGQRVVYLQTGFAAAAHRVGLDTPRPLLAINPRARLKELLQQRLPVYQALAWLTVVTDDRDPQEIADELAAAPAIQAAAVQQPQAGPGPGRGPDGERPPS